MGWLVILAAGAALGQAQTCGVAPNLNITGIWNNAGNHGEKFAFIDPGNGAVSLSNPGNVQLLGETISYTFVSVNSARTVFVFTFVYSYTNGDSGSGKDTFTLSPDGNSITAVESGIDRGFPYGPETFSLSRVTGSATLFPTGLTLRGTEGGGAVTDSTSLKLYNCGQGTESYQITSAAGFLTVIPAMVNLAPGASQPLTLTATPGSLEASQSPFNTTITVTSPTGDFGSATTAVEFDLVSAVSAKDQVSVSGFTPPPATAIEQGAVVPFTANVTYTVASAASGTLSLQLVDVTGAVLQNLDTRQLTTLGTFNVTLSDSYEFQDPINATLRVVLQVGSGAPIMMAIADYVVYPQPTLVVDSAGKEIWSGSVVNLPVAFRFTGGSPARQVVNVTIKGLSVGGQTVNVDNDPTHLYLVGFPGLTIPQTGNLTIQAVLKGDGGFLLDVTSTFGPIKIDPPPTNFNVLMVAGPDGHYFPANKENFIAGDTGLSAKVAYTGLGDDATLTAIKFQNGLNFEVGETTAPPCANCTNTVIRPLQGKFENPATFRFVLMNHFGQSVQTPDTAIQSPEFINIVSADYEDGTANASLKFAFGAPSSIIASTAIYDDSLKKTRDLSPLDCFGPLVGPFVSENSSCAPSLGTLSKGEDQAKLSIAIVHANGTSGVTASATVTLPVTGPVAANATYSAGPASFTPNSAAGNETLQNNPTDLGAVIGTGPTAVALAPPGGQIASLAARAAGLGAPVAPGSLLFLNGTLNFSPSIPNNGSFRAQFVYQYSSGVLPDDPGFNPSNLELVSYDPSTQQLLTYPSTVNTAAQSVTAAIDSLAPYYALAVPASTLGSALNLPLDPQYEAAAATVAVLNAGTVPVNTSLIARGPDGTALAPNPTTGPILPGQQIAASFASLGAANVGSGWVQAYADAGTAGVALLSDSGREGLALSASSTAVVISGMQLASGQFTELDVANATPFQNNVTLELHDLTGALQGQSQVVLAPKGSYSSTLEADFTNAASPLQGYVVVRGTERLTASALVRTGTALAAINGQPLSLGAAGARALYAPHFLAGGGYASRLDIANPAALDAHVMIEGNKDDGTLFAKAISVTIKAGTAYSSDIGTLLGLNPQTGTTGSISISSDVSGLVGDVALADTAPTPFHSAAIALAAPLGSAVIPYVYNTSVSPMTLYVVNTSTAKATVQVGVLAANGSTVGQTTVSIPAGGRSEQPLSTLVTASAGQTGGAIQIISDQPVAAVAMILPVAPNADFAAIPAAPSSLGSRAAGPKPSINAGGIVNAASFTSPLARGGLASMFGTNLASGNVPAESLPLPVSLQGTFVTVGGVPAPMVFAAPGQINFQVPFEVPAGSTAQVVVTFNGAASAAATVTLADYAVGVFEDFASGLPIVVHGADNSLVTAANPAVPGETVVVYATGVGKLNNPPPSGGPSPGSVLATSVDQPTITVGGSNARVLFSGLTPGFVGLIQFNITLPASLPSGNLPLEVQFPGNSSAPVNLPVKGNR